MDKYKYTYVNSTDEQSKKYFFENERLLKLFDFIQKIVFIIGIPLSIISYYHNNAKETEERAFSGYNKLSDEYWNYESMCTRFPLIGVSDATQADSGLAKFVKPESTISGEEQIIRRQMMGLSLSMYERAYLMYFERSTELQKAQWDGWAIPLKKWVNNKIFVSAWYAIGDQFDTRFQEYVNDSVFNHNSYKK